MKNILLIAILFTTFMVSCSSNEPRNLVHEATATSDNFYAGFEPDKLTDTINSTLWNSGSRGSHWVNFNFKKPVQVDKIDFTVNVDKDSEMKYSVLVKVNEAKDYSVLSSEQLVAKNKQTFSVSKKLENITDVKIEITNNVTWPSIRSVDIIGID